MNLLHLDSSALGAASVSRQLTAEIVARQKALHPDMVVTYRDLLGDVPQKYGRARAELVGSE